MQQFNNSAKDLLKFESQSLRNLAKPLLAVKDTEKLIEALSERQILIEYYKKAKQGLKQLYDKTIKELQEVFGITDMKDENNSNANLNLKKDKDEQFAMHRKSLGYVASFLKNIFLI